MNQTHKRIPRLAECLQWDGLNTEAVLSFLNKHYFIGDLFKNIYIFVRFNGGGIEHTLSHGHWVLEGEDGKIRFYTDEKFQSMYQPIVKNDELERLRAFVREILNVDGDYGDYLNVYQMAYAAEKHGITADMLEVPK